MDALIEIQLHERIGEKAGEVMEVYQSVHPEDQPKILTALNHVFSQQKLLKKKTDTSLEEIKEVTGYYLTKAIEVGQHLDSREVPELREALDGNFDYGAMSEDIDFTKYTLFELGRITYEAGLVIGLIQRSYETTEIKDIPIGIA